MTSDSKSFQASIQVFLKQSRPYDSPSLETCGVASDIHTRAIKVTKQTKLATAKCTEAMKIRSKTVPEESPHVCSYSISAPQPCAALLRGGWGGLSGPQCEWPEEACTSTAHAWTAQPYPASHHDGACAAPPITSDGASGSLLQSGGQTGDGRGCDGVWETGRRQAGMLSGSRRQVNG